LGVGFTWKDGSSERKKPAPLSVGRGMQVGVAASGVGTGRTNGSQ
jgi:hypothetical protein